MKLLVTDEEVNCSKYDKVVMLPKEGNKSCYRDNLGVYFDCCNTLLYVEKRQVKIHSMNITYSTTSVIKPKEIEHYLDDTWVLRANKVGVSDQEVVITGTVNKNHPDLYCLKKEQQ